ncbi:MAG TPA: MlaE family lipid ABC transporter permease subunit [Syntrophorhabdaceae bacterium]|nr:MlaE family lipid ABC transporter permease subunit [Syntrophorhabdaceae bacterium]
MPDNAAFLSFEGKRNGDVTILLSGNVGLSQFDTLLSQIQLIFDEHNPSRLTVDLEKVEYLDSAGALFLAELKEEAEKRSVPFAVIHASGKKEQMMSLVDMDAIHAHSLAASERSLNLVEQIGNETLNVLKDLYEVILFFGELITETVYSLGHPRKVRWVEVVSSMKKVGVDGVPIVALISFLLGLIIAFMSALQLKQFGANIYVASLVAVAMVRELGPIITAIIVAGRSGSAFAAEIGTMRVNEEVDALITMGFNPIRFLAIPKLFASLVVVPILTGFSNIFAVIGGLVVGVAGLNLTIFTYVQQTMNAIVLFDVEAGIAKSTVFAVFIAAIGCERGFQVRGGAEAVGSATTSAVVSAIFLIIVIDSTFAIILHYIQ